MVQLTGTWPLSPRCYERSYERSFHKHATESYDRAGLRSEGQDPDQ